MTVSRITYYFSAAAASLVFLAAGVIFFIPPSEIFNLIVRGLNNQGLSLTSEQVSRVFPLGIKCTKITLSDTSPLLNLDTAEIRLDLLPLLAGNISVTIEADAAGGNIIAKVYMGRKKGANLSANHLSLLKIPYFKTAFIGDLDSEVDIKGTFTGFPPAAKGRLFISSKAVQTRGLIINGMALPDSIYRSVKAAFSLSGNRLNAESIALDGEGIYARLTGGMNISDNFTSSPLDFRLELMPKPDFIEKQKLIFLLLSKYTVSPGNYAIPVKGTLSSPSIL